VRRQFDNLSTIWHSKIVSFCQLLINHGTKIPLKNAIVPSPVRWHVVLAATAQVEGTPTCRPPGSWCLLFLHVSEFKLGLPHFGRCKRPLTVKNCSTCVSYDVNSVVLPRPFLLRPSTPQPVLMRGWQCSSGPLLTDQSVALTSG
jgi:hypothetical protein